MYLFDEDAAKAARPGAVAFLDDHTLVMGSRAAVEQTIDAKASGGGPAGNAAMTALLETCARVDLLDGRRPVGAVADAGRAGARRRRPGMSLPPLKTVVVTGDLDPVVSFEVTGEAADDAAAQNLADVVRGFVALATLQASQKPELKQLASAVSVTTDANKVRIAARFPYELLDSLRPKKPRRRSRRPAVASAERGAPPAPPLLLGALPFAPCSPSPRTPLFVPTETMAVAVRTPDQLLVALHARPQKRLKDELNGNSDHFVALTAPGLRRRGSRLLYESSVVLLDSGSIVSVTPLSAVGPPPRRGRRSWPA